MSLNDWSQDQAKIKAVELGLTWDDQLESWVNLTRQFYMAYDHSPRMRVLVKYLQQHDDPNLTSLMLQAKMDKNPAIILAELAGVPKPKQCF